MKKIDVTKPETQVIIGVSLMIAAMVVFVVLPLLIIMPIYSLAGQNSLESATTSDTTQKLHLAEVLIRTIQIVSPLLFIVGLVLTFIGYRKRKHA